MKRRIRALLILVQAMAVVTLLSSRLRADSGTCGGVMTTVPFTDVASSIFFCQIAEAYFSGQTNGTSATTYSPGQNVPREQMAAFITRTMDQSLKRGSRRAALDQYWTTMPRYLPILGDLGTTTVGTTPQSVESDGEDLWVASFDSKTVSRVHGSDGKLLGTWTGATNAADVLVAMGRVFVTGGTIPGKLYMIDPTAAPGAVTEMTGAGLGSEPVGIAFDGTRIWTANQGGSVSIITPTFGTPWLVTNVTTGFTNPVGILFDGSNVWVTDEIANTLLKLDAAGVIRQTVSVGTRPHLPVFDGTNIWVPNGISNSVTVVRASTGAVIATLTGNGLNQPFQAAFDGQRILVPNFSGNSVSLWKASDLTPIGEFSTGIGTGPDRACSDGVNFWITLVATNQLARF